MYRPKKTTDQFIKQAKEIHGDKYDYSQVEYIRYHDPVEIGCLIHTTFWQRPSGHLQGQGCPKCFGNPKKTTDEFIKQAKELHGDKYDYSQVEYNGAKQKVKIICSNHGDFYIRPNDHLCGQACFGCGQITSVQKRSKTTEEYIKQAKEIHGDKYDYSQVEYKGANAKVEIICPSHGSFHQDAQSHLSKHGCPGCANDKTAYEKYKDKPTTIYYNKVNDLWKIGIRLRTFGHRYNEDIRNGVVISELDTKLFVDGWEAYQLEQKILKEYESKKYTGPRVLVAGNTELFSEDVLVDFKMEVDYG